MSVVLLPMVDNSPGSRPRGQDISRSSGSSNDSNNGTNHIGSGSSNRSNSSSSNNNTSNRSSSSRSSKTNNKRHSTIDHGRDADSSSVGVRGSDHPAEMLKGLHELWRDNQLTDVTLKAGGRSFHCHRNVLASASPYFRRMFCTNMQESRAKVVTLKGVSSESLAAILDFAYTSQMTFTRETVPHILEVSDMLLMPLVKEACIDFMSARLATSNCLSIYTLAERYNCGDLAERAWTFALQNFHYVRKHPEILDQPVELLEKYLSTDDLVIEEEEEVFETMVAWISKNRKERIPHIQKLMTHLREHLLPTQYLVDKVLSHPLLSKSQALTVEATATRHRRDLTYTDQHQARSRSRRVVLVVGGIGPANIKLTEVKYYDPIDRRWSTFSHLPFDSEPVSCVAALDGDVYVVGSRGSFIVHRSKDSTWNVLPSLPRDRMRQRLACASSHNNLYFVGGFDGEQRVRMVDRFDTRDNTWHEMESLPVAVSSPATAVFGDKLFVFGGALANGTATDLVCSYDIKSIDSDIGGLSSRIWRQLSPMPHAFSGITAAVLGSHVYVVGCVATVVHRYDPEADSWDQAGSLSNTHALCGAAVCGDKIYVTGGENQPNSPINGVEAYDPATNRWSPGQNLPYPIRLHGCASVIKRI